MVKQGGCIVTKVDSETKKVKVLLIQSVSNKKQWVIPKGCIDFGETAEQVCLFTFIYFFQFNLYQFILFIYILHYIIHTSLYRPQLEKLKKSLAIEVI